MDFEHTLRLPLAQKVLGHHLLLDEDSLPFAVGVVSRIDFLLRNPENLSPLADIGTTALNAFLQCNVTGPPLSFDSAEVILPKAYRVPESSISDLRQSLLKDLSIDGEAIYQLIPNIELFWLAKSINNHEAIADQKNGRRTRARTNFIHQRLLFEDSELLRESIYSDLEHVEQSLQGSHTTANAAADFLIERATVNVFYGQDGKAREDLTRATKLRRFDFALTGRLGKRTKFQQFDLSQLVVLACSAQAESAKEAGEVENIVEHTNTAVQSKPQNLDLNDDTLLESISFSKGEKTSNLPSVEEESSLPPTLNALDPADQPLLSPEDSIILLSTASSITNTSPADGLTREETLPYAVRVLEGGSSNWQIYTQALLVRSRIEGYNSRTAERGLLQLQALVDQVIADTTTPGQEGEANSTPATFLPRPKATESASAGERLEYIFSLASPFRWTLEAELAQRWVTMGGLRSALEIYERLQMWPEVALCFAATDQESRAVGVVRKLLFKPSESTEANEVPEHYGPELATLPPDTPRLLCILGDLEPDLAIQHYTRAWEVSNHRYARAQRSLARLYSKQKSFALAAEAYQKSLQVNRLNAPSWFALGCVQLELEDYAGAATSFTQMVQLEETDAEAWSNLAVALLRLPVGQNSNESSSSDATSPENRSTLYHNRLSALRALQRATSLKPTDARLWDNYLTVSSSLPPSLTPWSQIILAQSRVLSLQKSESSIDIPILTRVLDHITSNNTSLSDKERSFLTTQLSTLFTTSITPLITTSPELWHLSSRLSQHLSRPAAALDAEEKAWRIVTSRPGIYETEKSWNEVVDATIRLVQKYQELGPMKKEGLANSSSTSDSAAVKEGDGPDNAANDFIPVAKDYLFKARSAVRSVLGKGKATGMFDDTQAMTRLREAGEELKSAGR